ncbi:MAG: amidohydrolase [Proteobacteria bacterium]|nr:amidohydrolase [Pseudomonadota bacterium]
MTAAKRDYPFIDYGSVPPTPEIAKTGPHLANYRRVYEQSERATHAGPRTRESLPDYLAMYEKLGARHVVVKARDLETTFGFRVRNEDVAEFCRKHGARYIGFAGVDPHKGMTAIRELEFAVKELGLRGLNLQCFEHKLRINDPKMFPLYAKCIELKIPVNVHCSVNFSTATSMDFGRPLYLDDVMVHFPELKMVAAPPGWPWCQELLAVAWRHANVWIGLVAVRPKYLAVANSGYEPLLQYGNTVLQDRMIYGTSYPMVPVAGSLAEIDALPLKESVRKKWLHDNAARLLGLD